MADKKISELPVLDLGEMVDAGDALLAVSYDGANYSVPLSALREWCTSATACGDVEPEEDGEDGDGEDAEA